jgi:hypothetical protein
MKLKPSLKMRSSRAAANMDVDEINAPRGYGAMREVALNLDPRIDLTKPIYEQVAELQKAETAARP